MSGNNKLTDACLTHLAGLSNLQELEVPVQTDSGFERIGQIESLKKLNLSAGGRTTDQGLLQLVRLKNLEELEIRATSITKEGVAQLQAAHPNLKIKHNSLRGRR